MLIDIMPAAAKPTDPVWTTSIMTSELGGLIKCQTRAYHRVKAGGSPTAILGNAYIELAGLITQCRVLAEQMNWKWADLQRDGEEQFRDMMKVITEKGL